MAGVSKLGETHTLARLIRYVSRCSNSLPFENILFRFLPHNLAAADGQDVCKQLTHTVVLKSAVVLSFASPSQGRG